MIELPERRTCHVNGIDKSYLTEGSGPAFIMIHGLMSNALDFYFQFSDFSSRFTCIAPDIRGSGLSHTDDPVSVSLYQAVDDMLEFITETVPPDQKIILLGHSFGGIITLELLARIPERIKAAVIVSAPAAIASNPFIPMFPLVVPLIKPLLANKTAIAFYSNFINMHPFNLTQALKELLHERNALLCESDLLSMQGYFTSVAGWKPDLPDEAREIPAILFYGDRDLLFTRRDIESLQSVLPQIKCFNIENTGHSCMQEKHQEFNQILDVFIRDIS